MRPDRRLIRTALLAALALSPAACDQGPSEPPSRTTDELVFLRAVEGAPPLETYEVSFWAVAGRNSEVEIRYLPYLGQNDFEDCLEFKIPGDAMLRHPDGRRVQRGDSVRITIRVVDPALFNFEFLPAGLQFDPEKPAELRVSYKWADPDYDDDGDVDDEDEDFDFGIWRQERNGDPWEEVGTARVKGLQEVRAELTGFTKYAMAGGH